MLRLSKKVDYALTALIHLAHQGEGSSWSAREIAKGYGLPPDLLAKILQKLAREGLVVSHQGTKGGYSLGRPADRIQVVSVIEAVDGPLSLTQCFTDEGTCDQFDTCNVKSPLQRLNDQVLAMLSQVTIAGMCEEDFQILTAGLKEVRLPVVQSRVSRD
ncbi:MAG: RrF2 family transcriptional regulator [Vicinamibacteria bacterium]